MRLAQYLFCLLSTLKKQIDFKKTDLLQCELFVSSFYQMDFNCFFGCESLRLNETVLAMLKFSLVMTVNKIYFDYQFISLAVEFK